jgi:AcrR family transcriptional regulator
LRAGFYAHFDSKEDLLASGIEGLRASLEERQRQALAEARDDASVLAFSHELFAHANACRLPRDGGQAEWRRISETRHSGDQNRWKQVTQA